MKKSVLFFEGPGFVFAFLIAACFGFFSCAGNPGSVSGTEDPVRSFLETSSSGNTLVFYGVAGDRLDKKEALKLALEDAARKVAFYQWIQGRIFQKESDGGGFWDYTMESTVELDYDMNYKVYVEELSYDPETDVLWENNSVYVRTRYAPSGRIPVTYRSGSKKSKPSWINEHPGHISGLPVGVGYANPRFYHKDTVIASYENAVIDLIKRFSYDVDVEKIDSRNTGGAFTSNKTSIKSNFTASGRLTGFYVLDIWIDPVNQGVWTLAVARDPAKP